MSDSITDLEDTLHAHTENKRRGTAYISSIHADTDTIHVGFELPAGTDTFDDTWDTTDNPVSTLYDLTDASPPCVDTLIGEPVPVRWDDSRGNWHLDVDELAPPQDDTLRTRIKSRFMSPFDTQPDPTDWAEHIQNVQILTFGGSVILGAMFGSALHHSQWATISIGFLLMLLWLGAALQTYPLLQTLYRGDYDWITD